MKIIQRTLELLRVKGFATRYGTAHQLNDFFTDVDFSQSKDNTAAYMHLITAMESYDGKDRAEVAVYFARLCDFDFDGESLLPAQEEMKGYGEELLRSIACGNEMKIIGRARWQFGYDDFAENVCWVCMRVTVEDMAAFCVPFGEGCQPKPEPPVPPTPTPDYLYIEAQEDGSYVYFASKMVNAPILEYSFDGVSFSNWEHREEDGFHIYDTINLDNTGDRVYFRGDNPGGTADAYNNRLSGFIFGGKVKAGGSIVSLLIPEDFDGVTELKEMSNLFGMKYHLLKEYDYCLTEPPTIGNVTIIGARGMYGMFYECRALVRPVSMENITTIKEYGCYSTYYSCIEMQYIHDFLLLRIINDYGCKGMFYNINSVNSGASMPLLESIGRDGCANMYYNAKIKQPSDMPSLKTVGVNGLKECYRFNSLLERPSNMPNVETFGRDACYLMYNYTHLNLVENDRLAFGFPQLPVSAGTATFSTPCEVAEWMGRPCQ